MVSRLEQHIASNKLCRKDQRVLLAVSGGLDSMVMTDLFRRAGYAFDVAHVNFQLRGTDSDDDESFVRVYCERHAVGFHSCRFETNNYATGRKLSVQMAARELRYNFFAQLVKQGAGELVATAHHLGDAFETIMLSLLRGGGVDSLAGIPLKRDQIIRPLMFATRDELEAYAAEQALTWREDVTNFSDDYRRNYIRHHVTPHIVNLNPAYDEAIARTMVRARGEQELVERAASDFKKSFVEVDGDQIFISKAGVEGLHRPEAILLMLLEPFGFNFATCVDIIASIRAQSGTQFLTSSHRLIIDRTNLSLSPLPETWLPTRIEHECVARVPGRFELSVSEQAGRSFNADPDLVFLDRDKIQFPLLWRSWREGDVFYPLGMNSRKKISDFLVDLKVPLNAKDDVTVLESGENIVCLPGFRVDERFKITNSTTRSLVVALRKLVKS